MSSVLMVQCPFLECNHKIKDNKFITTAYVSENQSHQDTSLAIALQNDVQERLEKDLNIKVVNLRLVDEPRANRAHYEGKNECLFVADSVSIHHFTNHNGEIERRVVVLYPMCKHRQGELPRDQLLKRVTNKANAGDGAMEVVDLREYEKSGKFLEGLGALIFSHDGDFVYMGLSGRSNEEVLETLCSEDNLNIPECNRFVFATEFPHSEKSPAVDPVYHTNMIGWCGKGICAWGFEFLKFDSKTKEEAFYEHIEETYQKIINLNAKEIRGFAGNACELVTRTGNGEERRVLCISDTAMKTLQLRNKKIIEEWYGPENIFIFYGDVVQRRNGVSVRGLLSNTILHGKVIAAEGEQSAIEVADIGVRENDRRI